MKRRQRAYNQRFCKGLIFWFCSWLYLLKWKYLKGKSIYLSNGVWGNQRQYSSRYHMTAQEKLMKMINTSLTSNNRQGGWKASLKSFSPPLLLFCDSADFYGRTMTLLYLSLFTHPDFLHFPKQRFALCGFHFFRNFYGHFGGGFLKCAGFERFEFCSCQGDLI